MVSSSMPFKNRPLEMTDKGHPNTSTTNAGKVDSCRIDQREKMTNSHASPVSGELTFCVTFHYQSTMTSLTNCPFLWQISDSSRPLLAALISPSCPPKTGQTNLSSNCSHWRQTKNFFDSFIKKIIPPNYPHGHPPLEVTSNWIQVPDY